MAKIEIEVKRVRSSVTQGSADVYINGEKTISFGEEISLIPEGGVYFGEMIDGYASTIPDANFICSAVLGRPLVEQSKQIDQPFIKELERTKAADARRRPERETVQMIQAAIKEKLPFDAKLVDAGIVDILNTEIYGHKVDLGASLEWLSDPDDPDLPDGTYYEFNLYVDGVYVSVPGAWPLQEIQNEPDCLVDNIVGAYEYAVLKMGGTFDPAEQKEPDEPCVRNNNSVKLRR